MRVGALRHFSEIDARLLRAADLEDQRLFEHQRAIAGDGLRLAVLRSRASRAASPKD